MKNLNLSKILFLLITVLIAIVSYKQLKNFQIQYNLLNEFNQNKFSESTYQKIKEASLDFPNLGVSVLPLKAMAAEYFYRHQEFDEAINLLYESMEENPYLGFNESKLSILYDKLNIRDSFYFYAKKAFYKVPNNAVHWGYYVKALNTMNYTDSIIEEFKKVEKSNNQLVWSYFMGGLMDKEKNYDSILKKTAFIAQEKFKKPRKNLKAFIEASIYGNENIKKADSLFQLANEFSNKNDFPNAEKNFKNAIEIYPNNLEYYENLGLTYSKWEKFDLAIEIFSSALDKFQPKDGKIEYYLGLIYYKLGKTKKGCDFLTIASNYNHIDSGVRLKTLCK